MTLKYRAGIVKAWFDEDRAFFALLCAACTLVGIIIGSTLS